MMGKYARVLIIGMASLLGATIVAFLSVHLLPFQFEQWALSLIGVVVGFVAFLGVMGETVGYSLQDVFARRRVKREETYAERVAGLTRELQHRSREFDSMLREISELGQVRAKEIEELETRLTQLSEREAKLRTAVEALEKAPLEVVEYFGRISAQRERKAARRDYLIFVFGMVTSTIIAIALNMALG